jgi:hypothetical protein
MTPIFVPAMFRLLAHERMTVTDRTAKDKWGGMDSKTRAERGRRPAIGVPSTIGFR